MLYDYQACYTTIYGFQLFSHRKLLVTTIPTGKGQRVEVTGTDVEGFPFSYLKQVTEGVWLVNSF